MQLNLLPFYNDHNFSAIFEIFQTNDEIKCRYQIAGDVSKISLKKDISGERKLYLWEDTCFEFFLKPQDREDYYEFNFSSNTDFNIFHLQFYRAPIKETDDFEVSSALIEVKDDSLIFEVNLKPNIKLKGNYDFLATMVIKLNDGNLSYWAVNHSSDKPDFHDPATYKNEITFD